MNAKFKNAKEYWNMLKELSHVKPANILLSSFEQYFKAVNNPTDPFYVPDEDVVNFNEQYAKNEFDIIFDELNLDFTQDEVLNAIKQLKLNKSGGPDYLINEFIIYGSTYSQTRYAISLIKFLKLDASQMSGQKGTLFHCIKKAVSMMLEIIGA